MAAPVLSSIVLPEDTLNGGKKVQTQSEVVGADTVHAHYFIPRSRRKVLGVYSGNPGIQSVVNGAHNGTATGLLWLQNILASGVHARLRRVALQFSIAGEADMQTVPRIAVGRFSFTGAASGAAVPVCKRSSADPAATVVLRTAMTGMAITLQPVGGYLWSVLVPTFGITTSGATWNAGPHALWAPEDEDEWLDLGPGEGAVFYQPDAGTAADTRRFSCSVTWDEYDSA